MTPQIKIFEPSSQDEIKKAVKTILDSFSELLPKELNALILIKPNLNSHMNALAGNTTDLRLIRAVIKELQLRGYSNVVITEGTNSGFYRNNISVIHRLKVDRLGELLSVKVVDLNYVEGVSIPFEHGLYADLAKICTVAALIINLPKLKTHFEAGITVCLKNMIGCMVSQINKKKVHNDLPRNILNINKAIHPQIHIIDALIAMEGNGPTRGIPLNYGKIIAGNNPFVLDYFCSRLMEIPYKKIDFLKIAIKEKLLSPDDKKYVDNFPIENHQRQFLPAKGNLIVRFIFNPRLQKYFQALRATKFFTYICSTKIGGKILFHTGIRQDVFIEEEENIKALKYKPDICTNCGKCAEYCPMERKLPDDIEKNTAQCLHCLYCLSVCPDDAIYIEGNLGFFSEQLRQYGDIIKKIV